MELINLQQKIGTWHSETFGDPCNICDLIRNKLTEEVIELRAAQFEATPGAEADEAADVAIALMAFCSRRGIDLNAAILRKHAINKQRKWKKTATGFERDKNPS